VVAQTVTDRVLASVSPEPDFDLPTWLDVTLRGCTRGVVREAAYVLTELLTNARRHAAPPYRMWVAARHNGHLIRLAVDDGAAPPEQPWSFGKGLFVVRGLCPGWGVAPAGGGKTVWADLPVLVAPLG
jgi:hypothetical protein